MFMSQRPHPSRRPDADQLKPPAQPPIWAEGRQAPPFALGAFLRVSLILTRRSLGPQLQRAARVLEFWGEKWRSGQLRVDCARLGRFARALPSHQSAGRLLLALSRLTRAAAEVVLPPSEPGQPLAYPDLMSARRPATATLQAPAFTSLRPVRPARPVPPRPPQPGLAATEEPFLLAVRDLLARTGPELPLPPQPGPVVVQLHPGVAAAPETPAKSRAAIASFGRLLHKNWARLIAYGLIGLCFAFGAARAFLLHLGGTDLRHWD